MKPTITPFMKRANTLAGVGVVALSLMLTSTVFAQGEPTLEELEEQVAQQRIALEEAITNREATAAKVAEVNAELDKSKAEQEQINEELKTLCDEQESLKPGSYDNCMTSSDS